MQRLEVSGAVRPLYGSLGVKGLIYSLAEKYNCVLANFTGHKTAVRKLQNGRRNPAI